MRQQRLFTDAYIRNLKVPGTEKETTAGQPYKRAEPAPRGEGRLIVRVLPNGTKEFFYRYRQDGADTTLSLGRYDAEGKNGKTLEQIRNDPKAGLSAIKARQRATGDVKADLALEARQRHLERRKGTFAQLLSAYASALEQAGKPSAKEVQRLFRRNVTEPFLELAGTKANEIQEPDIQRILARLVKRGVKRQVNVTRSYLRAAFAHGAKADHDPRTIAKDGVLFGLKHNPVSIVPKITEFESEGGTRVLTEDELRAYWLGLESLPVAQRQSLRFNLAIACQRPKQLLRAGWGAFDWELRTDDYQGPALTLRDIKGRGEHRDQIIPLPTLAMEQLKPLREMNSEAPTPFTSDGKRALVLTTLSVAVREVSDALHKSHKIPKFQQRDLRRTVETMLQSLRIDREVRAHLLSHGRTKGVQGKHYERYAFLPEKRAALRKWTAHLERIIDGKPGAKVVRLQQRSTA